MPVVTPEVAEEQLRRIQELWGVDPIMDLSYRLLEGIFNGGSDTEDIVACITDSKGVTREEVRERLGTVGSGLLALEYFTIFITPFTTPEQKMDSTAETVFGWCSAITSGIATQ